MSRYKIMDQKGLTFVTCTVVGWVDIFSRKTYRDMVLESLAFCRQEKQLRIFAYVLMTNHLHMIIQTERQSPNGLSAILRDFKKFTANKIIEAVQSDQESRREWLLHVFRYYARTNINNRYFQFWIQDNHPIAVEHPQIAWQKVHYIHSNPVRAGWVEKPEDYLYSSARNYAFDNKNCLMEVDLLEPFLPKAGRIFLPGKR